MEVSVQHSCSSCVQNQVFLFTCIIDSVTIICGNCSPLGFDTNGVLFACLLSRVWLFCDPMDCSLPGSYVHGISQARILEQIAISYSRGLPNPGIKPVSPALVGGFFTIEPPEKPSFIITVFTPAQAEVCSLWFIPQSLC